MESAFERSYYDEVKKSDVLREINNELIESVDKLKKDKAKLLDLIKKLESGYENIKTLNASEDKGINWVCEQAMKKISKMKGQ